MLRSYRMGSREWITLHYPDPQFVDGMMRFVKFVKEHLPGRESIHCPCTRCRCLRLPCLIDDVVIDLIKYGFNPTYKVWNMHGENASPKCTERASTSHQCPSVADLNNIVNAVVEDLGGNNLDKVIQDEPNVAPEAEDITGDTSTNEFEANLRDAMTELYPGCHKFTVLTFIVQLFKLKVNHGWSEQSFTALLQLLQSVLPSGNKTPINTYQAKKIIIKLGLDYQKIHACPNDCMLYWREHEVKTSCPNRGASRYKTEVNLKSRRAQVPKKVLRYFPLTPRLQRMYSVPWVAKEMTWHSTGKMQSGKMGHPVDSSTWKFVDNKYKDFSAETRNVRLGLATDGFNPYGTFSTSYSSWPVMCVTYNLPPHLCMKPQFTMLTLLIEGPRPPGKDIDVYLEPLIVELQDLWRKGMTTFDAYHGNRFNMHTILLWTIHDFPAYDSLRLRHGKKHVYMGHRRWLPLNDEARKDTSAGTFNKKAEPRPQPIRLTGIELESITTKLNVQRGEIRKRKQMGTKGGQEQADDAESSCFLKRSILYDLEYWKDIPVRHNLDVMHIEKNVCEILIALMLNTTGKTKDDANARRDLKWLGIKKRLWLENINGKVIQKRGPFLLRKEEKKIFIQTLRELRVPIGFSGNWKNIVNEDSVDLKGMKSHDYHVLMQHLLPILIQHAFRDSKHMRTIIRSFCTFFNALCSRTIDIEMLMVLEKGMARTLCELEITCPPSIFVVMMHLPIHLAYEARVCGPVYYRWMYPFERFMKTFKAYVRNKTRPEGCIAERYIQEETLIYCNQYKGKNNTSLLEKLEKRFDGSISLLPKLQDIVDDFDVDEVGPVGLGQSVILEGIEYEQARTWVLKSQPNYDTWQGKYANFLKQRTVVAGKRTKVASDEEFIPWLKKQLDLDESSNEVFKDIVRGPKAFAMQYNKYCINGFLFVTKDYEENKVNQNSGGSTESMTTFRSSAKDKNTVDESVPYYGVLCKIIQLEYREGYKPVLLKCDWVKVTHQGVSFDAEGNLRLVNLSNFLSSDQVGDEPFILAEHAVQVFYSRDPKNPDWHVVLEVPRKIFVEDETSLLSETGVVTDAEVGPNLTEVEMGGELLFNDNEDICVVVEKEKKRKRVGRKS
ncbi:uncharacterized protein LOC131232380 [Magnolia sinica]|uniref:uncharacterized protein LOC131232380 n=1 Tax=Magnolia sinica TaxID=86752 RepID=UPI002659DB6B|nr:uncharacterized protein LOC131232380 [Magnolia sinica]